MKNWQGFIIILIVLIVAKITGDQYRQNKIQNWANENNFTIAKTEQCFIECGPFWFSDANDTIYIE